MPTVTWERGLMRWWAVVNLVPAALYLVVLLYAFAVAEPPMPVDVFGGFLVLGALALGVSFVAVRTLIWIIRGFVGSRPSPPPPQ